MSKITIDRNEYNIICNDAEATSVALEHVLKERGLSEATFGNVYVYLALDGGVGAWFVDEQGHRIPNIDSALAYHGL